MRFQSGDLLVNFVERPSPTVTGRCEAAGTVVTTTGEILWTFSSLDYPSFWSPARIAQEVLAWAMDYKGDVIYELGQTRTTDTETVFVVKEAA